MLKTGVMTLISLLDIILFKISGFFSKKTLAELTLQSRESILILVPHADDESIGCGAILRKHAENNSTITLVNMTDGCGSMSNLDRDNLRKIRKDELHQICCALKINDIIHLDFTDGMLEVGEDSISRIAEIIWTRKPDVIYVPFFCDFHKDHVATSQILASALRRTCLSCQIRTYEIQVPITPVLFNSYLEISDSLYNYKKNLLRQYQSQTLSLDSVFLSWELNAAFIKNARRVEVFFVTDSSTYSFLVEFFVRNCEEWVKHFYASGNKAKILLTYFKGWRIRKKILTQVLDLNPL